MNRLAGLKELGERIAQFETKIDDARLTILSHSNHEEIARLLIEGLLGTHAEGKKIKIETSTGEYLNHIAILELGSSKYTFSLDHQDVFISSINDFTCRITPTSHGILVYHKDYPGVIHDVSRILADHQINIWSLNVSRVQRGKDALLVSLTDEKIPPSILAQIRSLPLVTQVNALQ